MVQAQLAQPDGGLDVRGGGDIYLVDDPDAPNSNSVFLPSSVLLAPFPGTNKAFVQARVPNPTASTSLALVLRTTYQGALRETLRLNADGSAAFYGTVTASGVTLTSDARFKTDVRPLGGALASVLALRGVRYRWNALGVQHGGAAGCEQVGLLAQELERGYPELVSTDAQGYKSVNYAQLTPVLLEAIKELKAENDALRAGLTQDHASLQTLQAQVARLLAAAGQAQR